MSKHCRIALHIWPFVLMGIIMLGLSRAEQELFPVVESFSVTQVSREADGVLIKGHMNKSRACEFIGVTATGDTDGKLALKFMDDDSPGTFSRPTGSQEWGPWKVFTPVAPRVNTITLTAAHSCHPFWVTRTDLVTIVINGG